MTTIYTSKKTGATYTMKALENGKFQLTSTEDNTDIITTTESVLKRWYKKSIVVDFTKAEEKPKSNRKIGKRGPRAKTYEEQKWGLGHTRISADSFCKMFDLSSVGYDDRNRKVVLFIDAKPVAHRGANGNELTGSVWFRFKNHEYELTDIMF